LINQLNVSEFLAYTIGILVFLVGVHINKRVAFLRNFNIPEAVTGGLIAAALVSLFFLLSNTQITFDLSTRDRLLVYFFSAIGLNSRLTDLLKGGKPLAVLLVLTIAYIVLQNVVGVGTSSLLGLPSQLGMLAGSISLIGGHGTAIAWAPEIQVQGLENAMEIGVSCATLGLVIASLIGGPIARVLINKHKLTGEVSAKPMVGIEYDKAQTENINHLNIMTVLLTLHVAIIFGHLANELVTLMGFKIPLFVTCLFSAIIMSNTVPFIFPNMKWPARTRGLALVSDFSLGLFLAMSLMSMQLWKLSAIAGPLLLILLAQTLAAVFFTLLVFFPLMGKDYQAAVLSAGFGGFALGATPTAIANMTAVTKTHGPAPTAFIILPLVAAFFVDIINSFVIRIGLSL
jgi:ESS family glutamate:Na+ symporter